MDRFRHKEIKVEMHMITCCQDAKPMLPGLIVPHMIEGLRLQELTLISLPRGPLPKERVFET